MAKPQPNIEDLAQEGPLTEHEVSPVLKAKRAELAKLREAKELELIDAEMERLKNGGKGPKTVQAFKDMERVRAETVKETVNGKVFGLYSVPHRSYVDPKGQGGEPMLNEKDAVVRRSIDELPDLTWKPVKVSDTPLERKYVAA